MIHYLYTPQCLRHRVVGRVRKYPPTVGRGDGGAVSGGGQVGDLDEGGVGGGDAHGLGGGGGDGVQAELIGRGGEGLGLLPGHAAVACIEDELRIPRLWKLVKVQSTENLNKPADERRLTFPFSTCALPDASPVVLALQQPLPGVIVAEDGPSQSSEVLGAATGSPENERYPYKLPIKK